MMKAGPGREMSGMSKGREDRRSSAIESAGRSDQEELAVQAKQHSVFTNFGESYGKSLDCHRMPRSPDVLTFFLQFSLRKLLVSWCSLFLYLGTTLHVSW
jgi:hypothetical protein